MSKSRKMLFMAVIFLSNIAIMGTTFYAVIMTQMYANYEEWAVNMAMSIPGLVGLVACLLAGKIADLVDKKIFFIVGLVMFGISASTLALPDNSILLIAMAALNGGVSYGIVSVSTIGIISDAFADEEERSKVMGYYNGSMALIGSVLSLIYGLLAEISWKMAPAANWAVIAVAALAIVAIHACPPKKGAVVKEEKVKGEKDWAKPLISILIAFFCVSFSFATITQYLDLYITANGLGTSSFTGLCGSVQTLCSFVFCSLFGFTYGKLKTRVTIPAYCAIALAVFLMYFFPVKAVALVANGLLGAGWGTVYTFWFFRSTVVVPENMVGTAAGMVTTANSLSYFPIPYVLTALMGALHTENFRTLFPIYGGIVVIAAVLAVVTNLRKKENAEA